MQEPAAALLSNLVLTLKVKEMQRVLSIEEEIKIMEILDKSVIPYFLEILPRRNLISSRCTLRRDFEEIWYIRFACTINFVGVAWA